MPLRLDHDMAAKPRAARIGITPLVNVSIPIRRIDPHAVLAVTPKDGSVADWVGDQTDSQNYALLVKQPLGYGKRSAMCSLTMPQSHRTTTEPEERSGRRFTIELKINHQCLSNGFCMISLCKILPIF